MPNVESTAALVIKEVLEDGMINDRALLKLSEAMIERLLDLEQRIEKLERKLRTS